MMADKSWKVLEREAARILGGERLVRGDDFGGDPDCDVAVMHDPRARIDAKKYQRHAHHVMFAEVERKYVEPGQYAVLVTQEKRGTATGAVGRTLPILATVRIETLAELMRDAAAYRAWTRRPKVEGECSCSGDQAHERCEAHR